jgi:hypothetical protein
MRETTKHRQAYNAYVALGAERSVERLHAVLSAEGKSPSVRSLFEWSRTFGWQRRIDDFERKARVVEDEARLKAVREMQDRQAREGVLLQSKGAEWLSNVDDERPTPEAAIRAIVEGAKLERLARGEATERTDIKSGVDARLQEITDEELEELIRLAAGAVEGAESEKP